MNDIQQLLQHVASELQQEGKAPSLALFRARLAGRVSPQQLFAAYQHWRSNPVYASVTPSNTVPDSLPARKTEADDITERLARIEAKLDLLLGKLER